MLKNFEKSNTYTGTLEFSAEQIIAAGEALQSKHNIQFKLGLTEKSYIHPNPGIGELPIVQAPRLYTGDGTLSGKVVTKIAELEALPVEDSFKVDIKGEYNPDSKELRLGFFPPTSHKLTYLTGDYCQSPGNCVNPHRYGVFLDYLAFYSIIKPFKINLNNVDENGVIPLNDKGTIAGINYNYNLVLEPKCHLPKAPSGPSFDPKKDISPLSPVNPAPQKQPPKLQEFQPPVNPGSQSPVSPAPQKQPPKLQEFQPPVNPSQKNPHPKLPAFPTIP